MNNRGITNYIRVILILSALLLVLSFTWTGSAQAVMLKISEEELIIESDLIVTGVVKSINSKWNEERDNIYSEVIIYVNDEVGMGNFQREEIIIIVPGGEVDGIGQINSLSPILIPGQEVLLYLQEYSEDIYPALRITKSGYDKPLFKVYGHFQGKKDIAKGKINDISLDIYLEEINKVRKGAARVFNLDNLEMVTGDQLFVSQSQYVLSGQKWPSSAIPVKYKVNTSGGPSGSLNAIQNAADTWSNAGANFSFSYNGTHSRTNGFSNNSVNEVLFYDSSGGELGQAIWWYMSPGTIIEADFYFNTSHSWATSGTPVTGSPFDVQTVAMHEMGHWLSLDHSSNSSAIMYSFYQQVRRNLHSDDIAGIKAIYGASPILTINSINPTSGISISSSTGHDGTTSYSRTVAQGTSVTLTAPEYFGSGAERKSFQNWSGAVSSSNRTITMTMSENKTVTANYADDPEEISNQSFIDVSPDHPFFEEIEALAASGIITGWPDGTFRPTLTVTRQAMSAFLYRAFELSEVGEPPLEPTFSDVPIDHPFFEEIEALAASGITTGFPDGTFRPDLSVTRMATTAFLYRALGLADLGLTVPTFSDVPTTHPYFKEIEALAATGVTTGWPDGTFRPDLSVTRQAMAAFLIRALELDDQ